jgi:hypothetical protein
MSEWLEKYRKDLQTLRSSGQAKLDAILSLSPEEQDRLLAPTRAGSDSELDLRTIGERMWGQFHKEIVEGTKREVRAFLKLRPLFERLKGGKEADWEAFARMYHELGWKAAERMFSQLNSVSRSRPLSS